MRTYMYVCTLICSAQLHVRQQIKILRDLFNVVRNTEIYAPLVTLIGISLPLFGGQIGT